jgi:hypothetical protein
VASAQARSDGRCLRSAVCCGLLIGYRSECRRLEALKCKLVGSWTVFANRLGQQMLPLGRSAHTTNRFSAEVRYDITLWIQTVCRLLATIVHLFLAVTKQSSLCINKPFLIFYSIGRNLLLEGKPDR